MAEKKLRLGGMALANGVLVHGPTSWACAVRTDDRRPPGRLGREAADRRRSDRPLLRGPARLLEGLLVLPRVRRALPEARFPFERRNVLAAMAVAGLAARAIRESERLSPVAQELVGGAISLAPAMVALRERRAGGLPRRRAQVSIGSYEHGGCGRHGQGARALRDAPRRRR